MEGAFQRKVAKNTKTPKILKKQQKQQQMSNPTKYKESNGIKIQQIKR